MTHVFDKPGELAPRLRRRVAIDRVSPDVDGGRFAVKRLVGDRVLVQADIICDGHDELDCRLHVRHGETGQWTVEPLACVGNDLWEAAFSVDRMGLWQYAVTARVDPFATWLRLLGRRQEAGEDLALELAVGAELVEEAAHRAPAAAADEMARHATRLRGADGAQAARDARLRELMATYADRRDETRLDPARSIWVDRSRAGQGAWYEVFPRSWGPRGPHGTLADLSDRLDSIRGMGFDVLSLAPIHPIGTTCRKGRDNTPVAAEDDVGSPWAIGSSHGGHTAIHPELGTITDFERLRRRAESLGMELALDLALQCSPDHPWVREHPEWFRHRPDGTSRQAENPPHRHQDIVPLDFLCTQWRHLWAALGGVVRFWVDQGVRIFRVDNPHTKPFAFWEWLIGDIHATHPGVIFLAGAFARPKTMLRLAKVGFTQSSTSFTWRMEKRELADSLVEVTAPPIADFFRPNFCPNTPDILHESLRCGGRPMFMVRAALAALTVGNWGIYGPAFELLESTPRDPGSEDSLDSEIDEIRDRDLSAAGSLAPFITRLNEVRRTEPALTRIRPPVIQPIDDPHLLAWSRHDPATGSRVLVVVNLEPAVTRTGLVDLALDALGLAGVDAVVAHDLLDGSVHAWHLPALTIECTPQSPVRVFRIVPTAAEDTARTMRP